MTQTTVKNLKNPTFNSKTYKTPQKKIIIKKFEEKIKKKFYRLYISINGNCNKLGEWELQILHFFSYLIEGKYLMK